MQLDPTFLSIYIKTIQTYPLLYNDGTIDCAFLHCNECPLHKDNRCYIAVERNRLALNISPGSFEQTYIAPTLLQTHPELFI